MNVILHADDFGYDDDTLEATIECFEKGALSSCSVMVNCKASERAFEYARKHPEFSYGVHLTYVDELKPVSDPSSIPSLVDEHGLFLSSNDARKKALSWRLNQNEIISESQAQIDKMEKAGVAVSHLDSHGHLHKFPAFMYALRHLRIGGKSVEKIRSVQNVFIDNPSKKSPVYWLNKYFRWYLGRNFRNPDYFYMSANNMDTGWSDYILREMEFLPADATIEIGVHPGYNENWRLREFEDIMDFAKKVRNKHNIVTWNVLMD